MEAARKALVDEGAKQTHTLQDHYTALKKAKQQLDDVNAAYSESKDAVVKAQRSPNIKEKEIEKLNLKVTQYAEKVAAAEQNFKEIDEACKNAQLRYFQQLIPDLLQQLYNGEEERFVTIHNVLKNWAYMEKQFSEYRNKNADWMQDKIDSADVTGDLEDIFTEHMNASVVETDDPSKSNGIPSISVRSLINPIKAGRMQKKADENDTTWKPRYFVLMGDREAPTNPKYQPASGKLYIFDTEDALKPKGIIDLCVASVYSVDDSLYPGKQNLFLISTSLTTTEDNVLVTKHKTHYLAAESPEERESWLLALKRYALCCLPCISIYLAEPISLNLDNTERVVANFPKALTREVSYRTLRSVRMWIMEGRDFGRLEPKFAHHTESVFFGMGLQKNQLSPFCTIYVNDVKIGKTTTKNSNSPFWGEEFYFNELAECETEFRIAVNTHLKRRDIELGHIDIKLSQFKDMVSENHVHKKFEAWIPLQDFILKDVPSDDEDFSNRSSTGPSPALRVQAILTEESILPLYEYPVFANCLFAEDYRVLRTIAGSAEKCTSFARDEFARSLISILCATETDITGFRALLSVDVEGTDDPNIIFRGNTLATKAIDQYMKFIGSEYLKNTLSGVIKLVFEKAGRQESCEVDPTRLERPDEELLRKHQKRLLAWVQMFWDAIQGSVDKSPRNLRETLQNIREIVKASFERKNIEQKLISQVQLSAVSGFIFLRFFCPAILNPKLFGLWPEISENPVATRTLTLVAKVIQNLANLSDFRGKEPHMEFCNEWILWNLDSMRACILQFSSTNPTDEKVKPAHRYAFLFDDQSLNIDLSREFNYLFLHIQNNYMDLKQVYEEHSRNASSPTSPENGASGTSKKIDPKALYSLFTCLETLNLMYARYDLAFKNHRDKLENCSHLQKQFTLMNFASALGSVVQDDKKKNTLKKTATSQSARSRMISQPTLITSSNTDIGHSNNGSLLDLAQTGADEHKERRPTLLAQHSVSLLNKARAVNNNSAEHESDATGNGTLNNDATLASRKTTSRPLIQADLQDPSKQSNRNSMVLSAASSASRTTMDFAKSIEEELNRKLGIESPLAASASDERPPQISVSARLTSAPRPASIYVTASTSTTSSASVSAVNPKMTPSIAEEGSPGLSKRVKKWLGGGGKSENSSGELPNPEEPRTKHERSVSSPLIKKAK